MTNDALAPWIQAYRDENSGASLDARAIRRRVLVGMGARQRRRLTALRFVLPVAATFIGSVALAASQGALPRLEDVRAWLGVAETPSAPLPIAPRAKAKRGHQSSPAPSAAPPAPSAVLPAATVAPAPAPTPEPAASLSLEDLPVEPVKPTRPRRVSENALSIDLAAYEQAHRLHFGGSDPARALGAWDAYLASHPSGTFAPEARFNRAVCLLRLGRRSEARAVLEPIAEQSPGAYGRERARNMLDAME